MAEPMPGDSGVLEATPSTAGVSATSATPKSTTAPPHSSPSPPSKLDAPSQATTNPSKTPTAAVVAHTPADSVPPDLVTIPSYSKWFKWDAIHECEVRLIPEFFDGNSPSKNPSVYKYYRNEIVKKYRSNPARKISFTEIRRILVGDVGSIRRVFDFLDTWGLINYSPSGKQDKSSLVAGMGAGAGVVGSQGSDVLVSESGMGPNGEKAKKVCSFCKSSCSIACFVSEKYRLTLCARCYVRRDSTNAFNSSEFKRVEIFESSKTDWTDKETLQLLEAVTHYGDNWRRVAEHVGRSEKECVAHFVKLPFGEQFVDPVDADVVAEYGQETSPKRMRITPLADASNPILAQAAFLSALAGVDIAESAAEAAVTALHDIGQGKAQAEAEASLQKEEEDLEKALSYIEEQMLEIQYKFADYEEREFQLEKDWEQLNEMKHQLFLDQLALSFHKTTAPESQEIPVQETDRLG